jgi:hypothetical protein
MILIVACGSEGREAIGVSPNEPGGSSGGTSSGGFVDKAGCSAGGKTCVGNDVHDCSADGGVGAFVKSCDDTGNFCRGGECASGCEAAANQPTNVGCEFWAVDLDNEYSQANDAAAAPWGVVISNFGQGPAQVVVEQNDAPPGAPPQIKFVMTVTLAPGGASFCSTTTCAGP